MKTQFPKSHLHRPKYFIIDANGKTLGRLATDVSKLLRGKENTFYSPGIDQGNYVAIVNSQKIMVSGKKENDKIYYRISQRPGNLKKENYKTLKNRLPSRILEKAIWGMLPKGVLGRKQYKRLYVFSGNEIIFKKNQFENIEWVSLS